MKPSLHPARAAKTHSRWARLIALAAILLVLFGSFAQAAHVHGDYLPHHDQRATAASSSSLLANDEATCPLCVAMHAAILQQKQADDLHQVVLLQRLAAVQQRALERIVHYKLLSRPPPAALPQPLPTSLA